ncbi:citrulline utilization hydrolase CtlX [Candidatus Cetobacterium colombiensis]|uniref:Arginine deiminase-related protein n=1 Tax=Candidatus Cetobacterium colombiensis TaxID=3073100 RepID=A0ABU4WCF5_9FUSO|nr:arginine deiminase-related protein [Candidatus Cetobacterium colombiensis]MDX8336712.1 arginine deiminase-related protein [Candidatus Cetobacterium colombiensis]
MNSQITSKVLMIKPTKFYYNVETAVNNAYQKDLKEDPNLVQARALNEFDSLVEKIKSVGIEVDVINDTSTPYTPDSIFPNNWFSSHQDGKLIIYPMFANDRRLERAKFLSNLKEIQNKTSITVLDLTYFEKDDKFLEGTGALVLDRINKIAYCSLSPRANEDVLKEFCNLTNYKAIKFHSVQNINNILTPIYHTNVMMGVTENFVVICLDSITDLKEREKVITSISNSGKEIINITLNQVLKFCGNVLELKNLKGDRYTLMSKSAFQGFTKEQLEIIKKSSEIIFSDITTIETYGGGSVRCMIAELF